MSLKYKAALGALWAISSSLGARGIALISTLVLTYYLSPEEFGEVSIASVLFVSIDSFSSLGVAQYLISNPKSDRSDAFHVSVIQLSVGLLALGAASLLSGWLAALFEAPKIADYVPWLALTFAIGRFGAVPRVLLVRTMRFKILGLGQIYGEIVYAVAALGFAAAGYGGFAMVYGGIAPALVVTWLFIAQVDWREWLLPHRLELARFRKLLAYGVPFSMARALDLAARRWDNLLFAKLFGVATAGRYGLAYNLADIPATHIGEHVGDVLLPSFALLEGREAKHRALARASGLLALVIFPLAVGLGAVAEPLIQTFLPTNWEGLAPMLAVLSVLSVVRPLGWLLSSFLLAESRTGRLFFLQLVKASAILGFILLLAPFGELVACAAIGLGFTSHAAVGLLALQRSHGIAPGVLLRPMSGPLLACVPMVLAVVGLNELVSASALPAWSKLAAEVFAGALAYISSVWLVAREQADESLVLARGIFGRFLTQA